MEAEPRKQQARDKRAGDTDQNVADDTEARALNDLAGQPARNQADEQNNDDAFTGQIHGNFPLFCALSRVLREPTHNCPT